MGIFSLLSSRSRSLFLLGLSAVIVGLLFSKVFISVGSFILLGSWLLSGNLTAKLQSFSKNRTAIALCSLYFLHLVAMLYSANVDYGLKDLRIKIPLLLFPLLFATSKPLSTKEVRFFEWLFITAVFVSTIISTFYLFLGDESFAAEKRNISIFISHIRFSLMICLSFFMSIELIRNGKKKLVQFFLALLLLWLIVFLLLLESFTGLVVLVITSIIYTFIVLLKKQNKKGLVIASMILTGITLIGGSYLLNLYNLSQTAQIEKDLPYLTATKFGEKYAQPDIYHENPSRQNGYMVYKNIAWEELISSWNKASRLNFDSNTFNGYPLRHVVLWYLSSKGLSKDAEAVSSLGKDEILAIENGVSNHLYVNRLGVEARILASFWEISHYLEGGDINGHSITMRLEFWHTSIEILKNNLLIGVGTGDMKEVFKAYYENNDSVLEHKWRLRTYNQYLSFAVAFGLLGMIVVLCSLFFPLYKHRKIVPYLIFSVILLLSMINEDTLETQTGVTLYAFFNSFYLFLYRNSELIEK